MSSKIPKTGLAGQIRSWIKTAKGPFTVIDICGGIGIPPGPRRARVSAVVEDFTERWELIGLGADHRRRRPVRRFCYNTAYEKNLRSADTKQRVYKAMRLISFHSPFAATDIVKYTGVDGNYIHKIAKRLVRRGHLSNLGFRSRKSAYLDKFRTEVMK
jgi:hypothetical protein